MSSVELQEDNEGHLSCEKMRELRMFSLEKIKTLRGLHRSHSHPTPRRMSRQAFCSGAWWEGKEIVGISYNMRGSDWI